MSQSAANILTNARKAFWDAIDNYGPLEKAFRQKFRLSGARARTPLSDPPHDLREPTALVECPAIRLRPAGVTGEWQTGQSQKIEFGVEWKIWSDGLDSDRIELLAMTVVDAVYQAKSSVDSQCYVRSVLGGKMPKFGPIVFGQESIGDGETDNEQSVLTATGTLILPLNYQPVNYNVQ